MKVKSIYMKNFANVKEFSANIGPGINYILGANGSSKSTTGITAIWCCLQGIAEKNINGTEVLKGKRGMWVGRYDTDAEVEIVLIDLDGVEYTVNRKILENRLEITSSDGRKLDQAFLNSFWNSMMLSPVAFSRLSPKEQATMLGIDTTEFDNRIAELKEEASFVRREIKNFGEIEIPEKVEGINIFDLIQERVKIVDFNQEQDRLNRMRTEANGKIDFWVDRVARLRAELMEAEDMVNEKKKEYNAIPEPQEMLPTMEIDQKISAASETNAKAIAYEQAVKKQEEKAIKENDLADNIERQKAEIEKKTAYMQGLDLPFVNLTIDDNGGLMMDGRPIQTPHFSTGELIKICTMLIMSQNKDESGLRYVYLENFDLLDDTKSKELLDWMMGEDLQVLCERVVSNQPEVLILQDIK